MSDQDIIKEFIKNDKLISSRLSHKYLQNDGILYKNYLDNRFKESFDSYAEVIARIYYKIYTIPVCEYCGKTLKFKSFQKPYSRWCGQSCQLRDPKFIQWRTSVTDYKLIKEKSEQTCLEKYGDKNYRNSEKNKQTCLEKYGVEHPTQNKDIYKKVQQTCLEKYGVDNVFKSKIYQDKAKATKIEKYGNEYYTNIEKAKQTMLIRYNKSSYLETDEISELRHSKENREKVKQTCLEKYGVEHYSQTDDWKDKNKQTCLQKYGVERYVYTDEYKNKTYKTKKINKTFNTSNIENVLISYFDQNNINYKYQYKSDKYPFMCDFYFPDKDTYVEIQGNWTHGGHPYDTNNIDDINKLENWKLKNKKYYEVAIKVWSISDVKKREYAKNNNINLIEIFSIDFENIINILKDNKII